MAGRRGKKGKRKPPVWKQVDQAMAGPSVAELAMQGIVDRVFKDSLSPKMLFKTEKLGTLWPPPRGRMRK